MGSVGLVPPDGVAVHIASELEITSVGDQIAEIRLFVELDRATWLRVDRGHWFHLERRGPQFGGPFDPDRTVRIEARLCPTSLALVAAVCEPDEVGRLFAKPELSEVCSTERWFATHVTQEIAPGVRRGFEVPVLRPVGD